MEKRGYSKLEMSNVLHTYLLTGSCVVTTTSAQQSGSRVAAEVKGELGFSFSSATN